MRCLLTLIGAAAVCAACGAARTSTCDPAGLALGLPFENAGSLSGAFLAIPYGVRDTQHATVGNGGLDFATTDQLSVVAPASGTVATLTDNSAFGKDLQLDLGAGNCGVRLLFLDTVTVAVGQAVAMGDAVAKMAASGGKYHLHYELSGLQTTVASDGSNPTESSCPLRYSSGAAQAAMNILLAAQGSAIRTQWQQAIGDPVLARLGNAVHPTGYCYPLGTNSDIASTYP